MTFPRPNLPSRSVSRSGFTLVEILVVIAIIALLAGVALPAITGAIKKARENAALQSAHGLATAFFQYATDNNGVYPGSIPTATPAVTIASSTDAFNKELVPNYIANTDTLWISGGPGAKYNGAVPINIPTSAVSWDIVVHNSDGSGLIANDVDTTPVIMSTGSVVALSTPTSASPAAAKAIIDATHSGTNPFGTDGIAVGYKDMSSAFQSSSNTGGTAAGGFNVTSTSFGPPNALKQLAPAGAP